MPTGYQIKDQSAAYYLTTQVVNWIDIFSRKEYKDILIESLKFCQKEKYFEIYGYVIMSNHMHLIVRSGINDLSGTLRDFKKFTSKKIVEAIDKPQESRRKWILKILEFEAQKRKKVSNYQLWTHENHAIELFSNTFILEKLDYMHNNPVRAGIVEFPEDYLYSSARNYADLDSVLEIIKLSRTIERIR
ncbi:transposase [candidate division KSB1 bacterium]